MLPTDPIPTLEAENIPAPTRAADVEATSRRQLVVRQFLASDWRSWGISRPPWPM
jgi:hypothetical protein